LTGQTLIVWDGSGAPLGHDGLIYSWNGYAENGSIHSLLGYVEGHGQRLRRKYLDWIRELGQSRIDGQRVIDHLAFADGLSYWWLTPVFEKSPWKSPAIIDAIRLFALEEIVNESRPKQLRLVSANERLHEVVADMCRQLDVGYEWEKVSAAVKQDLERRLFRRLPVSLQGLISFARHLAARWSLRATKERQWFSGDRTVFFCSYFISVDPNAAESGRFQSYFWGGMHELLDRLGLHGNWLHLVISEGAAPAAGRASDWVRRFNSRKEEEGIHAFVDGYLSWRVVLRVLRRWFKLAPVARRLKEIRNSFRPAGSALWLWPLFCEEWNRSMRGPVAFSELLWIELFDEAMRDVPRQSKGFYLCENQAWERAFIHAWRKHGHGLLVGMNHSTVRFWDLRYFTDRHAVGSTEQFTIPQPDLIAVNGRAALDEFRRADFSENVLVECEALRYGYLSKLVAGRATGGPIDEPLRLLVLGDYLSSSTISMLSLLEAALSEVTRPISCMIKAHPSSPVKPEDYPSLKLKVVSAPLEDTLSSFDVAYCGNQTTAAADAYLAGLPVVVMLNDTDLNFSPLRGHSEISFVSTPKDLANALQSAVRHDSTSTADRNDFFFLDPDLPRWKHLLSSANVA
jgi:surface carbohydrate biosynthesis protein (TIGR04326 family)